MEKRKSLKELDKILNNRIKMHNESLEEFMRVADINNPQVKEMMVRIQAEIEVMEGIRLYCRTGESTLI